MLIITACICVSLIALIIACIVLAILMSKKREEGIKITDNNIYDDVFCPIPYLASVFNMIMGIIIENKLVISVACLLLIINVSFLLFKKENKSISQIVISVTTLCIQVFFLGYL